MRQQTWLLMAAGAVLVAGIGTWASAGPRPASPAAVTQEPDIEHVSPRRDSSGPAPRRFEWTATKGADHYAIGLWNEIPLLVWRKDDITTTSVERPDDVHLEPGTYLWSVSALRGNEQIADSGMAAFVVR